MRAVQMLLLLVATLLLGSAVLAQDEEFQVLNLRVSTSGRGATLIVDRGKSDGLRPGDLVRFTPRGGRTVAGVVTRVEERNAAVRMNDPNRIPPAGTRGEVRIPLSRFRSETPAEAETPAASGPQEGAEPQDLELPRGPVEFENEDPDWTPGMSLLAEVGVLRPADRALLVTGRAYVTADATYADQDGRSDTFLRVGTDLRYDNPFGRGGSLHVDAELNERSTNLPDQADEGDGYGRIDRLSYASGGTRFERDRWEVGRFLQYGMPEFGELDGYEWNRRFEDGTRVGVSVGYMPEPDAGHQTGEDFQLSAFYHWTLDTSEILTVDTGFQKTLHNGNSDRDLWVSKLRYLPEDDWSYDVTTWVDFYGTHDRAKGSGVGLTRAIASAHRSWDGNGLDVTYVHAEFPEFDRFEFLPVTLAQLADDHDDRLSLSGWTWMTAGTRLDARVGGWVDQDDKGGDVELGMDVRDLLLADSTMEFTVFVGQGKFVNQQGGRVSWEKPAKSGLWQVAYEYVLQDQKGFSEDVDDVQQHRVHLSRDWFGATGWYLSTYAEILFYDDENALSAGLHWQKSF